MAKETINKDLTGTLPDDVVVVYQIQQYDGSVFNQGDSKYDFLKLKDNNWDGEKNEILNLVEGTIGGDMVCGSQIPKNEWDFNIKRLTSV